MRLNVSPSLTVKVVPTCDENKQIIKKEHSPNSYVYLFFFLFVCVLPESPKH